MQSSEPFRPLRHPVQLEASIRRGSEAARPCKVTDFSLDGCCISGYFQVGEEVEVNIRSIGTFRAEVRWTKSAKAGARFMRKAPGRPVRNVLLADESGTSAIEYAILAAGVAVAIVGALTGLGLAVGGTWNDVDVAVDGTTFHSGGAPS